MYVIKKLNVADKHELSYSSCQWDFRYAHSTLWEFEKTKTRPIAVAGTLGDRRRKITILKKKNVCGNKTLLKQNMSVCNSGVFDWNRSWWPVRVTLRLLNLDIVPAQRQTVMVAPHTFLSEWLPALRLICQEKLPTLISKSSHHKCWTLTASGSIFISSFHPSSWRDF